MKTVAKNSKKTPTAGHVAAAIADLNEQQTLAAAARKKLAELAEILDQIEGRSQLAVDELRGLRT
jgi:hypothetical protein